MRGKQIKGCGSCTTAESQQHDSFFALMKTEQAQTPSLFSRPCFILRLNAKAMLIHIKSGAGGCTCSGGLDCILRN
jgi:hypothetical protein